MIRRRLANTIFIFLAAVFCSAVVLPTIGASSISKASAKIAASAFADPAPPLAYLRRIGFDDQLPYLFFASPLACDVFDNGFLVADFDNKITLLNKDFEVTRRVSTAAAVTDAVFFDGTIIYMQDNKIVFDQQNPLRQLQGDYDIFAVDKQHGLLLAVSGSMLYQLDILSLLSDTSEQIALTSHIRNQIQLPAHFEGKISALTTKQDDLMPIIYFSVGNATNRNFDDIYCFDSANGVFSRMFERSRKIERLVHTSVGLFALSGGEICLYTAFDGRLKIEASMFADAVTLAAFDNNLYMFDTQNSLLTCDFALSKAQTLFSSQSEHIGFFASPASTYTRRDSLFVADTQNDRLFVANDSGMRAIEGFSRINSVISDNQGNIFVSYDINKIARLGADYKILETFTSPRAIKKLLIDIDNNVLVLGGGELMLLAQNGQLNTLAHLGSVVDVAFVVGSKTLVVYDGGQAVSYSSPLDPQAASETLFSADDVVALATDIAGNIFYFDIYGSLLCYQSESGQSRTVDFLPSNDTDLRFATSIFVSNVQNEFVDYGDLVFADSVRHCIFRLEKSASGAIVTDSNHVKPDITQKSPINPSIPLVYRLKLAAEVFEKPIEIGGGLILPKGSRVFYYEDYNLFEEFAFVIFEDADVGRLVSGYVFRSLIDLSHYEYSAPPTLEAIAYFDNTPVYKFPSIYSAILDYYAKDSTIFLNNFSAPLASNNEFSAGSYVDNHGKVWYRVKVDESFDGFVQADMLSINKYVPQSRPKANAQIIAFEGMNFAELYYFDETDGTYKLILDELPLQAGTRIEILSTPLNPQSEFTEIRFFREGLGTLTCFVKTQHIQYDTVDKIQIVAILALVIVIVSGIVLIAVFVRIKKRKASFEETF